jgi:hypothetical protein
MSALFLAPAFLGFLGLVPVVILLYLLKLRRTEVTIASTMLWRKSLDDLTANAPFQRLRASLLLLLQIAILIALAAAMARPYVEAEGLRGRNHCLVIDASASMQSLENGVPRIDLAKARARELVDSLGDRDRMMVVSFDDSARVLCELTDDRRRLREAIGAVQASGRGTRIRDAANIVRSLAPDNPEDAAVVSQLSLVIISDGNIADLDALNTVNVDGMLFVRVGESRENAGITGFNVRRAGDRPDQRQAFVQMYNARAEPHTDTLSLYYAERADGPEQLLAVEEVRLPAGGGAQAVFALPEVESGILRATLDGGDALAADDTAWLILRPARGFDVLLVTPPDAPAAYFLRRVLLVDPRVRLSAVVPEHYAGDAGCDITIFNGWAPEALPAGALVFIGAPPLLPGLVAAGELEQPPVLAAEGGHPLMRMLNPAGVRIARARDVQLPEGASALVTTREGRALVADVSRGAAAAGGPGQPIVYVAFALEDSDWPLNLSFPLFFQNLLAWARPEGEAGHASIPVGAAIEVPPPGPGDERPAMRAAITRPDGRTAEIERDPLRPVYFADTGQSGVYRVAYGGATEHHAVNLLDRGESAIAPASELDLGRSRIAAQDGPARYRREFWPWLLAAAAAILLWEWWLYSRRAWL